MSLDNLGEFSNRGSDTTQATVTAEPPAQTGTPPPAQTVIQPAQEPKPTVTEAKPDTFMSDIVTAFQKSIPEEQPPVAEPAKPTEKPPGEPEKKSDGKSPEQVPEGRYGLPETPKNLSERGRQNWRNFEVSAISQIDAREKRIKELQGEIHAQKEALTVDQDEVGKLKGQLAEAHKVLEQTAIERSPMFKEKILDQQESIKGRLGKIAEGTSLSANDVNRLINGDLAAREEMLAAHPLSPMRQQQVVDLLERWDQVEEQRTSMLANGRQSYQEHVRKTQLEEEARKAQFVRESTAMFEDALTVLAPKMEPYQPIDGNQQWNDSIPVLKQHARKIFNGEVDKKVLAEVAILAPAAVVYQRVILPAAFARIQELTQQIERMRGVNPSITDRGGDSAMPTTVKTGSGDFVKDLVDRFRKEAGA
jgi:hypothetical protein